MSRTAISLEEPASVLVVRRRDGMPGHSMRPTTPIELGRSVIVLSTMVIATAFWRTLVTSALGRPLCGGDVIAPHPN
jgi:hypothetical protein